MRIAWFTHRYFPCVGGAENYGHEVDVVTSDAQDLWYFTDPSRARIDGPNRSVVDGAQVRRIAVRHWFGQRYAGRLLSYLPHWPTQCRYESFMPLLPGIDRVRGDYDAVFGVGFPYTAFSLGALKTARAAKAPLILTPFLHLATPGDKVNRAYTRPHQARLLKEADTVVVQTRMEADAVESWGVERSRTLILGMAVEHRDVTGGNPVSLRSRLRIPADARVVGHLATLDPNKGSTDLVRAALRINEARPAQPVHLILAGPSSPEFEAFAAELPPESAQWLHRLGPMPLDRRAEFFAALDVFAMPSRTDSFGIVFLEAWANGLPVVAAAAGGVVDVVRDDVDGLMVPFGDLDRLSDAIKRVVDDRQTARRLGSTGKDKVSRGYTWDDKYAMLEGRVRELRGEAAAVVLKKTA